MRLPVHPWAGKWVIGLFWTAAAALAASRLFHGAFAVASLFFLLVLAVFLFFFRNPSRPADTRPESLVSPADGRILEVCKNESSGSGECRRISIFLALWNVHVIRSPLDASVISRQTLRGSFYPAFFGKAGTQNQSITLGLNRRNLGLSMRLSAGFIARRIHCDILEGNRIEKGEIIGLIRFGSRVDLVIPACVTILVRPGMRIRAGTAIGLIHDNQNGLYHSQPVHPA